MRNIAIVVAIVLAGACGHVPVSPLAAAARAGDLTGIDRLLTAGADINAGSGVNNWPAVIHAVHKGQVAALERLLDRGASLGGDTGRRALDMASRDGDAPIVRVLEAHTGRQSDSATRPQAPWMGGPPAGPRPRL